MQEYLDNGVKLGWLFNRLAKQVEIYQCGKTKVVLEQPNKLLGEPILPNFILTLDGFW
ncbi:Uma2 family endonuclease [Moorena sp. SIO4A5]|uniref:Uma2 family endonuclease n=1 Tax=unclassified Moorena TaxID=2683338 RepID=UPI00341C10E8